MKFLPSKSKHCLSTFFHKMSYKITWQLSIVIIFQPPTQQFGNQCPPFSSDPQDPDPTAIPRCNADCAALCVGGSGMICGEVYQRGFGPQMNIYAKICTCYCPPQPCNPPTTTTTTTTTTTV